MKNIKSETVILNILWIGLFILAIELAAKIYYSDSEHVGPLISAMAILLSAAVASASVMKNIAETKAHDLAKSEKEKIRKRAYVYAVMSVIENQLNAFIEKNKFNNSNCKDDYKSQVKDIKKYLKSIFKDDIFTYLTDEQQKDIAKFYQEFVHFKSFTVESPSFCATVSRDSKKALSDLDEYRQKAQKYIEDYNPEKESQ